ncbi:hypothetical protein [Haloglomus irregulare]|nr:hypothetical protein [Haloglomus irregulare]
MSASLPPSGPSASYAPCYDCNEGSLVWDHEAQESRCSVCDSTL